MGEPAQSADFARPPHEDWCPFGDHEGECYEQLMDCMEKADPERWAAFMADHSDGEVAP